MTGWHLLDHENRHAPLRSNGKRFWGYPTRNSAIVGIVVHTAEALDPDWRPGDYTAEAVANYLDSVERPASAHVVIDTDSTVDLLPDHYTAFHAAGGNSCGLGLELGYYANRWGSDPLREERILDRAAAWAAAKCAAYGIPVGWHTDPDRWRRDGGFISHAALDPGRRSDPGAGFPRSQFLNLVATYLHGSPEEDDVPTFIKKARTSPDIYEVHGGYLVKVANSVVFNYMKRGATVDDNPPAEVKNLPVIDPAARASGGLSQADADARYAPLQHPHSGFSKNGHTHQIVSGTVK